MHKTMQTPGLPQHLPHWRRLIIWAVDWPAGWLDDETPVFDRVYKGFAQRGLWVTGHSSAAEDLLPGVLIGMWRPSDPERDRSS
jgi:hypothetical protein